LGNTGIEYCPGGCNAAYIMSERFGETFYSDLCLLLTYSGQKNKLHGKFGVQIKGKWRENVLTRTEGGDSFLEDKY